MSVRILVVDDDRNFVEFLSFHLKKGKYEVLNAYSGEEALSIIEREKPKIVLLDIRMPEMDGMECLSRIMALDKKIGVIMITGVEEEEIGKKAIKLGAFDYVVKPISLDYLRDCLMVKLLDITDEGR